jgi:hypothetical protein
VLRTVDGQPTATGSTQDQPIGGWLARPAIGDGSGMAPPTPSTITIELAPAASDSDYAAAVVAAWAAVTTAGLAERATIHTDGTVPDSVIEDRLESTLVAFPWGW